MNIFACCFYILWTKQQKRCWKKLWNEKFSATYFISILSLEKTKRDFSCEDYKCCYKIIIQTFFLNKIHIDKIPNEGQQSFQH